MRPQRPHLRRPGAAQELGGRAGELLYPQPHRAPAAVRAQGPGKYRTMERGRGCGRDDEGGAVKDGAMEENAPTKKIGDCGLLYTVPRIPKVPWNNGHRVVGESVE